MTGPKLADIEAKIDKGEALSPEEEKLLNDAPASTEEAKPDDAEVDPKKKVVVKNDDEDDAEDTPSEKGEEPEPSKKKDSEEDTAAKDAERKEAIKTDAEKPLDEVDLEHYTPRERALFFELKEERIKKQTAQREADTLKFQRAKEDKEKKIADEKAAKEAEEADEADPFEGMDDDDLLTAGQMKKLLASQKKSQKPAEPSKVEEAARKLQMENWVLKAQAKLPDVLEVLAFTDQYLEGDPVATEAVTEVVRKGGNPLIASYNYLKASPKWPEIEAKIKAKKEKADPPESDNEEEARTNKDRAQRIETNKKKPVTTGSGGGAPASGEYTIQELLDMPDAEFSKLPRAQRERALEALG